MSIFRATVLTCLVVLYIFLFTEQEQNAQNQDPSLEFALPDSFHKIAAGYIKQLASEILFIRTSVFLGGTRPGTPPATYSDALGNNFQVMTQLYPRFIDPYFFCQGFLPHISPDAAAKANTILETGITTYPDNLIFRFFHGTNFFLSMNEPLKGTKAFTEAAKLPNAPPIFGHLAALLSAQGGDIAAGLISLKTMLATENDEVVRTRYEEEIVIFEQATGVQKALNAYSNKYGAPPKTLALLIPEFLIELPVIGNSFILKYDPPNIHLHRPERSKSMH